ncbi:MAG: ThiF family adenylyltransferase [Candidatus Woesebacteria bacterium]|jgi:molybdopterin/thiamine biosynthesis adenylyltransferase
MLKTSLVPFWQSPKILSVKTEDDFAEVQKLYDSGQVRQFFDSAELAINELYDISYPEQKDLPKSQKTNYDNFAKKYLWPKGDFVFYQHNGLLVRFLGCEELRALRTSRNRNLITRQEQDKLYRSKIFVAGMSVGSNIVESLVTSGVGGCLALADMDIIEPSNLNRIRVPYWHVGMHKCDSVAIRMNEIDPYLHFDLHKKGIDMQNIRQIIEESKPDIIVDEVDQIQVKIALRRLAKQKRIAVVSAADDGDDALLDIERYDTDADLPIFNGLVPEDVVRGLEDANDMPRQQLGLLIGKYFVGSKNIPLRMFESLGEVGKTLPSWPQLGSAATQSGLAVAYACRKILLNQPIKAGRSVIGCDAALFSDKSDSKKLKIYQDQLDKFKF